MIEQRRIKGLPAALAWRMSASASSAELADTGSTPHRSSCPMSTLRLVALSSTTSTRRPLMEAGAG